MTGNAGSLALSYERCRALHRRHGRTYYLATRLLPRWKRRHVHALYGFTRYTDDIVDATGGEAPDIRAVRLRRWTDRVAEALDGAPVDDPILPALRHTLAVFQLDRDDLAAFLRSMTMDLTVTGYETYDDLLDYMAGSGAAIGSLMLPILGVGRGSSGHGLGVGGGKDTLAAAAERDRLVAAREPARQLGLAFQLTNFIRDVGDDLDRGRVYLPLKDLAEFGVGRQDLAARVATRPIRELIAFEVARAREHYRRAALGIAMLAPGSQPCIRAAYRLYGGILDEVVRAGYDVFTRRATVPGRRRVAVAVASVLAPAGRPVPTASAERADGEPPGADEA